MRKRLAGFLLAAALTGCGPKHTSFVKVDDVALGRVVIYRNGVAYYERRATVMGGTLTVSVPRDRVDDFLKSLTVVDAISRKPLPVSIPRQQDDGAFLVMKLQLPTKDKADVVLTYVTESPAWKPSYRVVVGDRGKVMLEGWAIVDNTSGEDWKDVRVGVGSSSALSFRYDLWSVRQVQRTMLQDTEQFAVAPPTGISPYGGATRDGAGGEALLSELGDEEIRRPAGHPDDRTAKRVAEKPADKAPAPAAAGKDDYDEEESYGSAEVLSVTGSSSRPGAAGRGMGPSADYGGRGTKLKGRRPAKEVAKADPRPAAAPPPPPPPMNDARMSAGDQKMREVAQSILRTDKNIVIEGYANPGRGGDAMRRATDRANIVRNQLIDQGVPPGRIKVVPKVDAGGGERVRLVAQAMAPEEQRAQQQAKQMDLTAQPVGESHFANPMPMTVEKGASAMVSMMRSETEGEVVYLYDAESERGNANFAFRAVRFMNPTGSTLETGPVTVYGNERFIGEGLTESIPPKASAVVPYALDRQIVVERHDNDENKISKLVTLQRGILTAQVQHIRRKQLTLTNRLREPAQVFIRHTAQKGWTLLPDSPAAFERIGDAHLFKVDLKPLEVRSITISEATPIERTLDLNADVTLEMMKVYVESPEGSPEVKDQLKKLLSIHKGLIDLAQEQESLRRRLGDYKERMDELHAQIVTLQAVKTGNDLMTHLKTKMRDISDRVQKTTIAIVDQEEKIMLARVRFQDALAEMTLNDVTAPAAAIATPKKP
ncbi:MAG TPA: OmpA family protein [Kofleriaceae bacterium]|nr:OmpA family protein [Kofleriaceae bacterium]